MDYVAALNDADEAIKEAGDEISLKILTPNPDPDQPWKATASTPTLITGRYGVFVKATQKYADGVDIHIGDQIVLVSAKDLALEPNLNGFLLRGSEVWKIVKVHPVKPGPIVVLYKIKVQQ